MSLTVEQITTMKQLKPQIEENPMFISLSAQGAKICTKEKVLVNRVAKDVAAELIACREMMPKLMDVADQLARRVTEAQTDRDMLVTHFDDMIEVLRMVNSWSDKTIKFMDAARKEWPARNTGRRRV